MKSTTQGFFVSARDHIGRMIDNVNPLDAIAIGSLTLVVKTQILSNPTLLAQWKNVLSVAEEVVTEPWRVWLSGILGYFGLGFLAIAQPSETP